eukprot:gene31348-37886_t
MRLLSNLLWLLLGPSRQQNTLEGLQGIQPVLNSPVLQFLPSDVTRINDTFATNMINTMNFVPVKVPPSVSEESVLTSFPTATNSQRSETPLVFVHGFDSSCLEFRRLFPQLARFRNVYAPDLLGWGFSDCKTVRDFSPRAKLEHLKCFIEQVVQQPCVLIGASLGGGIAINLATEICPDLVKGVVLLDAQGFIDGQGPSNLPRFVAKWGINVLKSRPLRSYANQISYVDKSFASEQAYLIGRLHCNMPDWERASIDFLLSGGFVTSPNIPKLNKPALVVWGKQDQILDVKYAYQFQSLLPDNELAIVDQCGHVPHLEKADETTDIIMRFLQKKGL